MNRPRAIRQVQEGLLAASQPEPAGLITGQAGTERSPARQQFRGSREIDLLPREFAILEYMMRNAGRPVTRTMLLNHVWDYQFEPQANVVDVHISRLRRKIDGPGEKPLIETLRGEGYRIRSAG